MFIIKNVLVDVIEKYLLFFLRLYFCTCFCFISGNEKEQFLPKNDE